MPSDSGRRSGLLKRHDSGIDAGDKNGRNHKRTMWQISTQDGRNTRTYLSSSSTPVESLVSRISSLKQWNGRIQWHRILLEVKMKVSTIMTNPYPPVRQVSSVDWNWQLDLTPSGPKSV